MTSRDGYNRNRPTRGTSSRPPRDTQRQGAGWELNPDELDRYMSGQPSKEPRFDPYGRSQTSGRTERTQSAPRPEQPRRQQPTEPAHQYEQFDDYGYEDDLTPQPQDDQWIDDDYGFEDELGYEEYQPEPDPVAEQHPRGQRRQPMRQRVQEPEYDDDLYDDPYVVDDDEAPRRPQRRRQRAERPQRPARPAPSFTLPPAIANAPIVKDQTALVMLGAAFASLLAMLIIVTTQRDGLGDVIFTHVNANGEPANLQTSDAIWNLPLIAAMVTVISAVLAWFIARWGEFLPRFLLGGSIAVQFIVWVAVIAYLF